MKVQRKFTKQGKDPFAGVRWTTRSSRISNPDGSVVFEMKDAEAPASWSQLATDIMVSKYFRKAGVPQGGGPRGLPSPGAKRGDATLGPEKSARQVIHRLAGCWRAWGEGFGYFDSADDAQAFYDELAHMMLHQMAAPNSPQWFNTGLNWAYGTTGPAQGHFVPDPTTGEVRLAQDAYTHPQPHACFIQSVSDDLVNDGGIMDLWVREARLFKYGSGTGTNFSHLRAEDERLSGGGKSSGLMSWLKIGDRAAGAIKSGGTTRRAAKMVCLDMDHPDIQRFINWKVREEVKVAALVEGLKALKKSDDEIRQTAERLGLTLDYDFNGEAYQTVSGQNSNNSVRIPDAFFQALEQGGKWETTWRTTGEVARVYDAKELWDQVGFAAWRSADPGVQFDSTINAWHTCPSAGRINASNPCSEYMFLDNTACNLASINLIQFYDSTTRAFDIEAYEHAIDLWTVVLEISVLMASYPSKEVAELSWKYRTLGLGYANFGAMAMQAGIAYDSDEARALCGAITAILTGRAYRMSALMAAEHGPFPGFGPDRDNMLRVIRNHRRAARGVSRDAAEWEDLTIRPVPIDHALFAAGRINVANADDLLIRAEVSWDEALSLGERHGYRNAQTTVIAPTGTIGLLMDCDTTGIEPDFALVKFKKLAGGGYFKIANASVRPALVALGYPDDQVRDILTYLLGTLHLDVPMPRPDGSIPDAPESFREFLLDRGLAPEDLEKITEALPGVFELRFAFSAWTVGDEGLGRLGIDPVEAKADHSFNLLRRLGLTRRQLDVLNRTICGTQTVEGAPHLRDEHLPVFDCANRCGKLGTRFIEPHGHIRAMAAAQPFISGAISKTINLPNEATVEDIKQAYLLSWALGLKANALYRDGCKLSQPLNVKADEEEADEEEAQLGKSSGSAASTGPAQPAAATAPSEAVALGSLSALEPQIRIVERPMRRRLTDTRASITHKFNVAGHEGYLTVGLYEDGMPGELFITMAKEGSTIGGLMDCLGTAVSVALQYGVPIESLVTKFTHQRFEPAGMTANRDIPFAKSLVDYIFRWMGMEFIPGYREANAPRRPGKEDKGASSGRKIATAEAAATNRLKEDTCTQSKDIRRHDRATTQGGGSALAGGAERAAGEGSHRRDGSEAVAAGGAVLISRRQVREETEIAAVATTDALSQAMLNNMGDAPACDVCGQITVRNGTCYKCLNCGNSMGCS
jgi:ribonucleoside-diphosphate reductase alpha chain